MTGYIYSFGYSNRTNYEAMDVLSIDARYLTRQVVTGAHKRYYGLRMDGKYQRRDASYDGNWRG